MDPTLWLSALTGGGMVFLLAYGLWERHYLEKVHYRVIHPRWRPELGTWRLAHLSDLHVLRLGRYQQRLVEEVQAAQPDVICLTGDLVDNRCGMDAMIKIAGRLQAPGGVWAVYGNREVDETFPMAEFARRLEQQAGVVVLRNAAAPVPGSQQTVWVVGVEFPHIDMLSLERHRRLATAEAEEDPGRELWFEELQAFARAAFRHVPQGAFRIGLIHTPDMLPPLLERDIELALAGHTHGGQARLPGGRPLTYHVRHVPRAWFTGRHTVGATQLVVSRGLGTSNLPFRVGCRPELVLVDIEGGQGDGGTGASAPTDAWRPHQQSGERAAK